jgi:ATP-dependent RNA helicase DeaD
VVLYEGTPMPFLGAHPSLLHALIDRGITEPTPVQRAILEVGNPSADLMVSAQTGSGKTVAFGLAIAPTVLGDAEQFAPVHRERGTPAPGPLALVVTPTRELAMQVARELTWLYATARGTIATAVGGMDVKREHQALARGPHFVIGTPGRLVDHLGRGALVLDRLQAVVLDEADEMLDMGFRDELEKILKATPATRRTLLFSATLPPGITQLAKRYQRDAIRIATATETEAHADIEHRAILIRPMDRVAATINVLRFHESRGTLVFCATRDGVTELARQLAERGFSVVALSGELSQRERTMALAQLRDGRARVLVATDVAARGLDLPDLDLVVHADLPQNREMLIHRSGRTGRAGRKGVSVILVPVQRRGFVDRVLSGKSSPLVWSPAPTVEEIEARDVARLDADLAKEISELGDRDRELGRSLAARVSAEDLAALVVRGRLQSAPAPAPVRPVDDRAPPPRRNDRMHDPRDARGPHDRGPRPHGRNDYPDQRGAGPNAGPPRRPPRADADHPNRSPGGYVVFRVNIGRRGNADPKWLVPVLCRRGEVDRQAIGKIRILQGETHVEIAREHAEAFATNAAKPDPRDRKIQITPLDAQG